MKTKSSTNEKRLLFTGDFTRRGLGLLLIFSFVATLIGFTVAYCEHKNYEDMLVKYDEAVSRIDECEASVASLMNSHTASNYTAETTQPVSYEKNEDEHTADSASLETVNQTPKNEVPSTAHETPSGYYVTQNGKKYHIASCSYLNKSKISISLERIKADGYSPCSRCIRQ